MNRELDKLTPEQRELLGVEAADELPACERWLAGRLGTAELPAGLAGRLGDLVGRELARQRRGRRRLYLLSLLGAAAAAVVVLAALAVLTDHPGGRPRVVAPPREAPTIAAKAVLQADRTVESYVAAVADEMRASGLGERELRLRDLSEESEEALLGPLAEPVS